MHNFQRIPLPTQSFLFLYSCCANLLHSLIMWVIVSSLYLYLLFCCDLSILALIWLVLITLFCAAIMRDFVFLWLFSLSHDHVFSCQVLLISRLKHPESWGFVSSSYFFRSVGFRIVNIVLGGCNQSFPELFYVVFKSLYWCVNSVFNIRNHLHPSFLDTYSLSTSSLGCQFHSATMFSLKSC